MFHVVMSSVYQWPYNGVLWWHTGRKKKLQRRHLASKSFFTSMEESQFEEVEVLDLLVMQNI